MLSELPEQEVLLLLQAETVHLMEQSCEAEVAVREPWGHLALREQTVSAMEEVTEVWVDRVASRTGAVEEAVGDTRAPEGKAAVYMEEIQLMEQEAVEEAVVELPEEVEVELECLARGQAEPQAAITWVGQQVLAERTVRTHLRRTRARGVRMEVEVEAAMEILLGMAQTVRAGPCALFGV